MTDPTELRVLQLEENTVRTNLSWEDERRTVAKLHKLYCEQAKARGEKWNEILLAFCCATPLLLLLWFLV